MEAAKYQYKLILVVNAEDIAWFDGRNAARAPIVINEIEFSPVVAGGRTSQAGSSGDGIANAGTTIRIFETQFQQVNSLEGISHETSAYFLPENDLPGAGDGSLHLMSVSIKPGTTVDELRASLLDGELRAYREHCRAYRVFVFASSLSVD